MKTEFIDRVSEYQNTLKKQSSEWINQIRDTNWQQFEAAGFPTVKHEEWKYTNLAELSAKRFQISSGVSGDTKTLIDYLGANDINIVFVDGNFVASLSNVKALPKGIKISSLDEAAQKNEPVIRESLTKTTPNDAQPFLSLNHALYKDGILIQIDAKAVVDSLIHIIHFATKNFESCVAFPKTVIESKQSSQASVLESYVSFEKISYFSNSVTDIFLDENAGLTYCKAQSESIHAFHIGQTRVWQRRDSRLNTFSFTNGAQLTRNNLSLTLDGEGTDSVLNGLYLMDDNQHVDNHTLVDNQQPNCTNRQLYKGILNGSSRAVFNGKIFVRQIAQKTNAYQLNKNLLMGKDCRIDTKPQLEIFADDVKCTHGATIGQLNEDELFYLRSRAIAESDAKKMLAQGFVDDIIHTIPNDSIQQKLNHLLHRSLAAIK